MNKFDSIISDLCEANGYPNQQQNTATNTNQQQQSTGTNNTNTNQPQNTGTNQQQQNTNTNQQQQNTNQQQKIDLQKLMTDFNNNTLSIKNVKDFEKYGLKAS
jgi:short subunit dehydrogenase-like uncharacterized protein